MASLFALSDRKTVIESDHLDAALAIWEHGGKSLKYLFRADRDKDSEKLLAALESAPNGLTKSQLWELWENKRSAEWFKDFLNKHPTIRRSKRRRTNRPSAAPRSGSPSTRW